ncbi:CHD5-like protein-domain-containing protein [Xylariaceae sp. FL0255]|nr:CHD5-like protein-domain-containing protein [Xylariaceae sp. FL0255]
MPSLLFVVLAVEVAVLLVNTIGAATINEVLWNIYLTLPTETSKQATEKKKLQKEYLTIRRDLNATSSQDQFAKWAKLRRQHDKILEQLEKMKASYEASKSNFDRMAGIIRWSATSGVKFILPWIYGKEAMFWLPNGWFPYYVEWILSFPRAPLGSVSIVSWQTACAGVVSLFSDTIKAIVALAFQNKHTAQAQKQPDKNRPTDTQNTMVALSWGTVKSLLLFFGPILLPKAIGYYRAIRASSQRAHQPIRPLSSPAQRALTILISISLAFLILAIFPPFTPENIFKQTQSRLQAPTDVLFTRLSSIRPGYQLTESDEALKQKLVSLDARLLYLQYGPDVVAGCTFCVSDEPRMYFYYALPALAAPHLANLVAVSLATSGPLSGPSAARWRRIAALSGAVLAALDLWVVGTYNTNANARAKSLPEMDMFFWTSRFYRLLSLVVLNAGVSALIYLSDTNRLFVLPPDPAARVEALGKHLHYVKGKLSGVGIVKNTMLRDDELRDRTAAYWTHEGTLMRDVMEDREVVEGVNDALANRIKITDVTRDAETFAGNMLPDRPPVAPGAGA